MDELPARVPGGALRIRVGGAPEGDRLLMLHGGPGLSDTYLDGLIAEFEDTFRVATYAQRGVAPSTAGGPYDLGTQADDVAAVLDALGWADAVVLGHSWGGHLLLHVVAAHPERVSAAIALEPVGAVGDGGEEAFGTELVGRLSPEAVARLGAPDLGPEEQLELLWPAYFAPGAPVPPVPPGTVLHPDVLEAGTAAMTPGRADLLRRLPGASVPVLLLTGEGSPMPESASRDTAGLIGDAARVASIPGAHFPWLVQPGAVGAAVHAFLTGSAHRRP